MRLLRQLTRHKLRTSLTILGITIGIWALVVFSSMANKLSSFVEGGRAYFAGKVLVQDASNIALATDTAARIRQIDGVATAVPEVNLAYDPEGGGLFGGNPLIGERGGSDEGLETFIEAAQGRFLRAEDEGRKVVVFGSDIARQEDASIGDTVTIRGQAFEVVGVLAPTLTAPDTTAYVPLQAAQQLLAASLPAPIRKAIRPDELINGVVVYPDPGISDDELARRVGAAVNNVQTMTGADFIGLVGEAFSIFNAITVGVAIISLVVGGLSVINTMAMSVAERTREIGIKRAIGGSRRRIVRELMTEAALIGLIGGLIGLLLGAIVVVVANEAGRDSGTVLFDLTPGTALFAVSFATILGGLAGLIPTWSAARLDPVEALRYE